MSGWGDTFNCMLTFSTLETDFLTSFSFSPKVLRHEYWNVWKSKTRTSELNHKMSFYSNIPQQLLWDRQKWSYVQTVQARPQKISGRRCSGRISNSRVLSSLYTSWKLGWHFQGQGQCFLYCGKGKMHCFQRAKLALNNVD